MAKQEMAYSVTKSFHTIRGTDPDNFRTNVEAMLGEDTFDAIKASFQVAFEIPDSMAEAESNAKEGLPGTERSDYKKAEQPKSKFQKGEEPPPTVEYPGDCQHGPRAYFSKNPRDGSPWPRWECALPFTRENKAERCPNVKVER